VNIVYIPFGIRVKKKILTVRIIGKEVLHYSAHHPYTILSISRWSGGI
jgi:hypothetical protein